MTMNIINTNLIHHLAEYSKTCISECHLQIVNEKSINLKNEIKKISDPGYVTKPRTIIQSIKTDKIVNWNLEEWELSEHS